MGDILLALLLLVFNLVLPNLVCANVAVVNVSGVVVRGMKGGTGEGDPLNELPKDVGDGAEELVARWGLFGRAWFTFCCTP